MVRMVVLVALETMVKPVKLVRLADKGAMV